MWLYFALLTPLLFAIVHVLDMHCVEDIFEEPWIGVVTSALASLIIFIPLPYLAPLLHWELPSATIVLMALGAGALIQFSQFFYFKALSLSEAGIIAAYWNMVPALVPVASFLVFSEILTTAQYIGISILVIASVCFCLLDSNIEARWNSFFLMFIAAIMQVAMFLLQDVVFEHIPYAEGFYLITTGLILAGLTPLLFTKCRAILMKGSRSLIQGTKFFVLIELANLAALASSQRAVSLGRPSLVAAVESTIPAYTFLLSMGLIVFLPKFGDPQSSKHLLSKLSLVGMMALSVWLVA
jgi:drug/metabolite transporter (DMT)-like permease